jgi:prepilin-type N-terminal cleavage/methylation domain-containing protein
MKQMGNEGGFSNDGKGAGGFTLLELIFCLTILSILVVAAVPLHLESLEKAKVVEATLALTEVVRLEHLRYADMGTYSSDLNELGFLGSPLKYNQLFVQVQKDAKGWSYIALAMPLEGRQSESGWAVAQYAGGKLQMNLPGTLNSRGRSACSIWSGWASMEGGRIEGEESLSASSSSSGGSPCSGLKVVQQGKK